MSCSVIEFSQITIASKDLEGASATLQRYKAIYYLNDSSDKKIKGTLRNINNAMKNPRIKGKVEVEVLTFGDGVEVFKKTKHYDSL
jgi:intracellular sulfur oxidation DsrE/DsrF family protein